MANPFPGMNPYLEDPSTWGDAHHRLLTYIADALQPNLVPKYVARLNERVYTNPWQSRIPDVLILERRARESAVAYAVRAPDATAAFSDELPPTEPILIDLAPTEEREAFIEIRRADDGQIVTVIEVLSPANKIPGIGRKAYLKKQRELIESETNLVEIDLIAWGKPTLAVARRRRETLPHYRYLISVHRCTRRYVFEMYPLRLPDRLPQMRIPLLPPDADVLLHVQRALNLVYDNGGYDALLNYAEPPRTLLDSAEAEWMDELLRAKNLRGIAKAAAS